MNRIQLASASNHNLLLSSQGVTNSALTGMIISHPVGQEDSDIGRYLNHGLLTTYSRFGRAVVL